MDLANNSTDAPADLQEIDDREIVERKLINEEY
jgi:hypothetical protein